VEDDASSTKSRSLLAIAGSLLTEISLPKLIVAWALLILLPALLLGAAPLIAGGWISGLSGRIADIAGAWPIIVLILLAGAAALGGRPLFRAAERSFWSLNSLAVQPGYALCREALRHAGERLLSRGAGEDAHARMRAWSAIGGGVVACAAALVFVALAWPHTRWHGSMADLTAPLRLVVPVLANAVVLLAVYLAGASLVWGLADGTMEQPRDLEAFDTVPPEARRWRIAHLSDIHVVGERYGFRIESGRAGPRGNDRLAQAFSRLEEIHAADPLDLVLVTGDMTDAGRPSEFAEFLDLLATHPALAEIMLVLPGNHDLNIVDRANPARLDLPTSPKKRLRQLRTLAAMEAVQGTRVRLPGTGPDGLGPTLSEAVAPHREAIARFGDRGGLLLSQRLSQVWDGSFPQILPPDGPDGLGVVVLNSNAETHFSFTNALGLVPAADARALAGLFAAQPRARWIIALHHHMVEYPKPAKAFSERIGTALVNGSWFVRLLQPHAKRLVAMHGHRHIDWIGTCAGLRIVSAPSPVMEATNRDPTCFYVHTLAAAPDGGLALLVPQRVDLPGEA
jgi:hypothetical protein